MDGMGQVTIGIVRMMQTQSSRSSLRAAVKEQWSRCWLVVPVSLTMMQGLSTNFMCVCARGYVGLCTLCVNVHTQPGHTLKQAPVDSDWLVLPAVGFGAE